LAKRGRPKKYFVKRSSFSYRTSRERRSRMTILSEARGFGTVTEWLDDLIDRQWQALVEKKNGG
jgi:hypothetical protein